MKTIELKAINWYSLEHQLKPQLSAYPIITFKDEANNVVTRNIAGMVTEYTKAHEEDVKMRARQRRLQAKETGK